MAVRLHINKDSAVQKDSELHLIPCKIHGDESAKVSSFFKPYVCQVDEEHYECSFRGYPLQGKKVTVPVGYKGMVFMEKKRKTDPEGKKRNLHCTGTFSQFTYWNYDRIPSENDAFSAALDWIDIADARGHEPNGGFIDTKMDARQSYEKKKGIKKNAGVTALRFLSGLSQDPWQLISDAILTGDSHMGDSDGRCAYRHGQLTCSKNHLEEMTGPSCP